MSSSDDSESDRAEAVYSSGDEIGEVRKKRLVRLRHKKVRSMEVDQIGGSEGHTGLSPRMKGMDIFAPQNLLTELNNEVFFLDEGIETFTVGCDEPRIRAVRQLYATLEKRLEMAMSSAGLANDNPAVSNLRKQLALRAAEIESWIAETYGVSTSTYNATLSNVASWLEAAPEAELREVFEGRARSILQIEDTVSHPLQQW